MKWILLMVIFSGGDIQNIVAGAGDSKKECEAAIVRNAEKAKELGVAIYQQCFSVTIVADPPKKPDNRGGNT